MIKYQESLNKIKEDYEETHCQGMGTCYDFEDIKLIQELVDKAIPKKPIKLTYKLLLDDGWSYECPRCKCAIGINTKAIDYTQEEGYCPTCGQAIDWS